ncbi:ArnT family glycosyltransferase [Chloroflexota bacterium]
MSNFFSKTNHLHNKLIGLWKIVPPILAALIFTAAVWIPRRMDLNRAVTADEIKWIARSYNFYLALNEREYSATYQAPHPGVSVMWLGAAGLLKEYQPHLGKLHDIGDEIITETYFRGILNNPLENLVSSRIFLSYAHLIVLLLAFWITIRLIGLYSALVAFLLIAFDPFHLALTRLLHLDGLLGNLYLLSIIAIISFLYKRRTYDLLISGAATGLSWLTKSSGLFLIPTVAVLFLLDIRQNPHQDTSISLSNRFSKYVWLFAIWLLAAILVFVVLWPATWVNPINVISKILSSTSGYTTGGHETPVFFNGRIIESGDLGLRFFYFYPLTYLWRTTPVVLLGLLAAIWAFFTNQDLFTKRSVRLTLFGLIVAVVIFVFGMSLGTKKFDRYLIPVYAPLDIIAALGWTAVAMWVKVKLPSAYSKVVSATILVLILGIQMASFSSIFPYNLSYYNPLLGGSRKAPQVMQIGWGEGLDQAAMYLNRKVGVKDLQVLSWYANGPFSFFFEGESIKIRGDNSTQDNFQNLRESDYLVIYIHQLQRDLPADLLAYINHWEPEHSIWINNIEYARIYKVPR